MRDLQANLHLLFVARAYPPTVGGMENFAFQLGRHLSQLTDVTFVVNRWGKKGLPLFLPYALGAASYFARCRGVQAIHLADALLAPTGVLLKRLTGLPVTASVCGLDVTFSNPVYQKLVPPALAQLDMTMPISKATEAELKARAGKSVASTVIALGVNPLPEPCEEEVKKLKDRIRLAPYQRLVLTVGRLIKRKGVEWFVSEVMVRLPGNVVYLVVGAGPEEARIRAAARAAGVESRVHLLGRVPETTLAAAYRLAELFVMPNIRVPGDMEGFGLVALEAAAAGLPVIASHLQGITEAVQHRQNGFLLPSGDADAFAETISWLLSLPRERLASFAAAFRDFTFREYSWHSTAEWYLETIRRVVEARALVRAA